MKIVKKSIRSFAPFNHGLRISGCFLVLVFLVNGCIFNRLISKPSKDSSKEVNYPMMPTSVEQLVNFIQHQDEPEKAIKRIDSRSVYLSAAVAGESHTANGWMVCDQSRNFRLVASKLGVEAIDFGSNESLFWFWMHGEPNIYFCSYDNYNRGIQLPFPFQPEWVLEVLGMQQTNSAKVDLAKFQVHENQNAIELSEQTELQGRPITKVVIFNRLDVRHANPPRPQILAYRIYDDNQRLIASASINKVTLDDRTQIVYPSSVSLEYPIQKMSLKIELSRVTINGQIQQDRFARLFNLPSDSSKKRVDLAELQPKSRPSSLPRNPSGDNSNVNNRLNSPKNTTLGNPSSDFTLGTPNPNTPPIRRAGGYP